MKSEIVLIMGYPASGKTSLASSFNGYKRLNRDQLGGTIKQLAVWLQDYINEGHSSFVLDNTFSTKEHRQYIIDVAKKNNIPVRCIWLKTSLEDCQLNASLRMIRKYGRILDDEELKQASKDDPNCFSAAVLFRHRKIFEKPTKEEGLDSIETVKFSRVWDSEYKHKALILDYDRTLRDTHSGGKYPESLEDIYILPNTKKKLLEYADQGYILCGVSNQSWIGKEVLSWDQVNEGFMHTNHLLGLEIDYRFCPHKVPPISCHCRKPQTGLGAELIEMYKLLPSKCIYVGDQTTDKTFAKRCGFNFTHADEFFGRN